MPLSDYDIKNDKWNTKGNWQFATKKGTDEEYFIKKYLKPTYPTLGDREIIEENRKKAAKWFEDRQSINKALKDLCDESGTLVIPIEFFNEGGMFYKITRKVVTDDSYNKPEHIAKLPLGTRIQMLKVISSALKPLHDVKFIHADIKPENILITTSSDTGSITCNIIDFDSGFYEGEPEKFVTKVEEKDKKKYNNEEYIYEDVPATPEYNSPEVVRYNLGPNASGEDKPYREYIHKITCKSDIFSLGLVFHEYLTGKRINFDKYPSPAGKAINEPLKVDKSITPYLSELLENMLICEPDKRPDINEVQKILRNCDDNGNPINVPPPPTTKYAVKKTGAKGNVVYSLYENGEIKVSVPEKTYLEKYAKKYPLKSSDPIPVDKNPSPPSGRYAVKKTGAKGNVVYSLYENGEIKMSVPEKTYLEKHTGTYPLK